MAAARGDWIINQQWNLNLPPTNDAKTPEPTIKKSQQVLKDNTEIAKIQQMARQQIEQKNMHISGQKVIQINPNQICLSKLGTEYFGGQSKLQPTIQTVYNNPNSETKPKIYPDDTIQEHKILRDTSST